MWEHRCKVAISGVGFSKVTRSAEIPLAAQSTGANVLGGTGKGTARASTGWREGPNQRREKMATLAATQRRHSHKSPHAYFCGQPLPPEDYLNSRMGAYPFCLYDCDIPV